MVRVAGGWDLPEEQGAVMREVSPSCQINEEGVQKHFSKMKHSIDETFLSKAGDTC